MDRQIKCTYEEIGGNIKGENCNNTLIIVNHLLLSSSSESSDSTFKDYLLYVG